MAYIIVHMNLRAKCNKRINIRDGIHKPCTFQNHRTRDTIVQKVQLCFLLKRDQLSSRYFRDIIQCKHIIYNVYVIY